MASQSLRDCSEAAGEVSSMYSTPNASRAVQNVVSVIGSDMNTDVLDKPFALIEGKN